MSIAALKDTLPDYAKDLKLNLSSLAGETVLSEQQRAGTFIACALAARNASTTQAVMASFAPQLSPEALSAAKAYANVQKAASLGAGGDTAAVSGGLGFGDILKSAMTDVVQSSRTAESQMVAQVQGKAELVDVATALSAAETSLETVMAVRDQVISAYQEIMRMPI